MTDEFDAYCKAIDSAKGSIENEKNKKFFSRMFREMIEGETIDVRRAARESIIARMQAIYRVSANAQAAAVDQFCKESLGVNPKPKEFSMPYDQAREIVGYVAKEVVDDR